MFKAIFECSADGIISIDSQGVIETFNPAAEKLFGYSADEVIGKNVNLLVPVNQKKEHDGYVKNSDLQGSRVFHKERELNGLHKSGELIPIEINVAPMNHGDEKKFVGVIRDISSRFEAEKSLFDQGNLDPEDRLHTHLFRAMKHAPIGIAYWDAEERLVHWNDRFEQLNSYFFQTPTRGAKFEDVLRSRTSTSTFHHPTDEIEEWIADRLQRFREGSSEREVRLTSPDQKTEHHFLVRQTRLPNGSTIIILSEETEQRQKEELHRSEQKMEAIGQLTGGIAHDFNNLLAVILGNLQLSLDMIENREQVERRIKRSIEAVRKGSSLTHRLLAFARQQALAPKHIDVLEFMRECPDYLQRALSENIGLRIETQPNIHKIMADPNQLENALLNLVTNARDAMPDGGEISITVSEIYIDKDYLNSHLEPLGSNVTIGNFVKFTIADNGEGIEPNNLNKVFEPFFTAKDVSKGRGLGASMVFGFAKQTGGHVEIESTLGLGTSVSMFLPWAAEEDQELPAKTEAPIEAPVSKGKRILLVEDDHELREIISAQLTELGFLVIDGGEGPNALDILEVVDDIEILVSDVVLANGLNGVNIAESAKKFSPDIKVLMMTGYADKFMQEKENLPVIYKPFEKEQLAKALQSAIA